MSQRKGNIFVSHTFPFHTEAFLYFKHFSFIIAYIYYRQFYLGPPPLLSVLDVFYCVDILFYLSITSNDVQLNTAVLYLL